MNLKLLLSLPVLMLSTGAVPLADTICAPGPYIIQFDRGSDVLPRGTRPILTAILGNHRACPETPLVINGHNEASEPDRLSVARAMRVRQGLVGLGVPVKLTHVQGLGSTEPRTGSPSEQGPSNARVEILFTDPAR